MIKIRILFLITMLFQAQHIYPDSSSESLVEKWTNPNSEYNLDIAEIRKLEAELDQLRQKHAIEHDMNCPDADYYRKLKKENPLVFNHIMKNHPIVKANDTRYEFYAYLVTIISILVSCIFLVTYVLPRFFNKENLVMLYLENMKAKLKAEIVAHKEKIK